MRSILILCALAGPAAAFSDPALFSAPVREGGGGGRQFTGAPGDGHSCSVCHTGGETPIVDLSGLPQRYVPGTRYQVTLRWDDTHGDRHSSLVVLLHRGDPADITEALRAACVNDVELAAGQEFWNTLDDPFGQFHADPCDDVDIEAPMADSPATGDSSDH